MFGKFYLSLTVALYLILGATQAQEKKQVRPPPKPVDEGPTLEATMKFIQERLSDPEKMTYLVYVHDDQAGTDFTAKMVNEITKVKADVSTCRIGYHWKATQNEKVNFDADFGIDLKDVEKIVVMPSEQYSKQVAAAGGRPELSFKYDPPVFNLKVSRPHQDSDGLLSFDEDLWNRVAKAMVHAVELCGGGSKDPF